MTKRPLGMAMRLRNPKLVIVACAAVASLAAVTPATPQSGYIDGANVGQLYDPTATFYGDLARHDLTPALRFLAAAAKRNPLTLAMIDQESVSDAIGEGLDDPMAREAALDAVEALYDAGWTPRVYDLDAARYALAVRLSDQGNVTKAFAVAHTVRRARNVLKMAIDRRFDGAAPNPTAAAEAEIDRTSAASEAAPLSLAAACRRLRALIDAGEADKAIPIANALLTRPKDWPPFSDASEQRPELLDERAYAFVAVGRLNEATADVDAAEQLSPNDVNSRAAQAFYRAMVLVEARRPDEAMKAIAPFGRYQLQPRVEIAELLARACAAAELNDGGSAFDAIAKLRQVGPDAAESLLEALVCAGDFDAAAATLVADLADPSTRADALLFVQDYSGAATVVSWIQAERSQIAKLRQRPDVDAAITKVGRVETWPFPDE